jgi:hypothetical protein
MCMLSPIIQRSPTQRSHRVQEAKGFVVFFLWKVATEQLTTNLSMFATTFNMILYTSHFPFVFDLLVLYIYVHLCILICF